MYLDYINLWSVEKTQALYRASVKFKLPHLCEKAVEYMMAKMSLDSIWPIFDAAIATEDQILSDECKKVSLHAHIVLSTSSLLRVLSLMMGPVIHFVNPFPFILLTFL